MTTIKTKEVKTVSGEHTFVLKEVITYGQHLDLIHIYADSEKETPSAILAKANKTGFEFVCVSIDGQTDNLYERYTSLPYPEVMPVVEAIREILNPKV